MRKHVFNCHQAKYSEVLRSLQPSTESAGTMESFFKKQKLDDNGGENMTMIGVVLELNVQKLKEYVRQICTVDGLPFNTFEKPGMSQIFNPIVRQLRGSNQPISLTSHQVRDIVLEGAVKLKQRIKQEIYGRMLCLKFDMATRLGRSFLGLNVQYGDSTGIHTHQDISYKGGTDCQHRR